MVGHWTEVVKRVACCHDAVRFWGYATACTADYGGPARSQLQSSAWPLSEPAQSIQSTMQASMLAPALGYSMALGSACPKHTYKQQRKHLCLHLPGYTVRTRAEPGQSPAQTALQDKEPPPPPNPSI
eukprot:scaffold130418_cov13-Tisochrysis_lutea.AAC.1